MKNIASFFMTFLIAFILEPLKPYIDRFVAQNRIVLFVYDLSDVEKPTRASAGAGGGFKSVIYAVLEEDVDIDNFPTRGDDLVTITGDIPLLSGKYLHEIYATEDTITPLENIVEGANRDASYFEITTNFFHPDLDKGIQEFKAKHHTSNFFILLKMCAIDRVYLIGEPCNTVYMSAAEGMIGKDLNESAGTNFTLLARQSLPMAFYEGALDSLLEPDSAS